MKSFTIAMLSMSLGCISAKEDTEEEEEEDDREEGDQQGDCTDGKDNDDDGFTDCDDNGCQNRPVCSSTDTGVEDTDPEPELSVFWGSSSLELVIGNANPEATYNFGVVENAGVCLGSEWGCWTGEDCFRGYDLTDGSNLLYCHPVRDTSLQLAYGAATYAVDEGSNTVFYSDEWSGFTTYLLDNAASSANNTCYTWGADTSYYNGYYKTCTEM